MLAKLNRLLLLAVVLLVLGALSLYGLLSLSLPNINNDVKSADVLGPVQVERDAMGIPTLTGEQRQDLAFATGYLHAQDRFFQMDLNRRTSAGELAELVGVSALPHDKRTRIHRFRAIAAQAVANLEPELYKLLASYARGVNRGLQDLGSRPFEYWLLGVRPQPWMPEDTFLTVFTMSLTLNDSHATLDEAKGLLSAIAGRPVAEFLSPRATRWEAALQPGVDGEFVEPEIPGPEQVNLRSYEAEKYAGLSGTLIEESFLGSNNFAVAGKLTSHGHAIVEDDMHLSLRVPTVWYRIQLVYLDAFKQRRINGVTLPGTPFVIAGSNGSVAWGMTNSNGDWSDRVLLELTEDGRYQTRSGPKAFEVARSMVQVKGALPVTVESRYTQWGPVVEAADGSLHALRWTAHNPQATNANLFRMEGVEDVFQGARVASRTGIPPQNLTLGDKHGNIAWTIAGKIPRRSGVDSTYPLTVAEAEDNWQGWLPVREYPGVINPESGRIWTANARVVSGKAYEKVGGGRYSPGPRALQIRNALFQKESFTEADFLRIALDDRAVYMDPWRQVALASLIKEQAVSPGRKAFKELIEGWSGHARVDDAGYRLVRAFHDAIKHKVLKYLGRYFLLRAPDEGVSVTTAIDDSWLQALNRKESSVLRLLEQQPGHWLPARYQSWDALVLETIDEVVAALGGASRLSARTWGERNTAAIEHPLASSIPVLGRLLNMPAVPLAGDVWSPRAQQPSKGVSERIVVAPGREEQAIFHMPGGQSGHPLSSFYRSGYNDWVEALPSPLLPGPARHSFTIVPLADDDGPEVE